VLIVRADSPARDIAGFHAMVRERGNRLNYGSAGSGTPLHLGGELYKLMMGVDLTHVAYRGSGPAITALIAGAVDMVFADVPGASGQIRAGTVRPLATMVQQRIPQLPNVPTMAESDPRLKDYDVYTWAMLVAPKATPDRAVNRLHEVAITALIAGEVDMVFADVPGASGQIRAGTVRPLATMVQQRIPQLPNVPTMAESDPRLKDYDVYTWAMLVAPKATPDRAIQRLHEVAIAAARQPDVMKRFEEMGFDYVGSSPADGDKRLEAERDKWRDVIKRANIKVDL